MRLAQWEGTLHGLAGEGSGRAGSRASTLRSGSESGLLVRGWGWIPGKALRFPWKLPPWASWEGGGLSSKPSPVGQGPGGAVSVWG